MMRKLIPALGLLTMLSCSEKKNDDGYSIPDIAIVPIDSANKMLGSYLNSIDYVGNDTTVRSLSFDADALRHYLTTPEGLSVKHLKIMFAHTLDYINSGHGNLNAGYRSGALTLIIAGYDGAGNYILTEGGGAFNNAMPCPNNCPPGNAADPFISASSAMNDE